jgi:23S rRNA-/tRNA-specific pseudouridylate synthase
MNYSCDVCQECFSSRNKLFMHIRSHSGNDVVESISNEMTEEQVVSVAYEDEYCRVIDKPQGLATTGRKTSCLLSHSVLLLKERVLPNVSYRKCVPCHRLDAATGGLLVCSKNKESEFLWFHCFRYKLILKRYVAIIPGVLHETINEGFITSVIDNREATTYFQVKSISKSKQYGKLSTICLWPITGRTHQLRRQMRELGNPIIGDTRFSGALSWPSSKQFHRLFLWAVELKYPDFTQLTAINAGGKISWNSGERTSDKEVAEIDDEDCEMTSGITSPAGTDASQLCIEDVSSWLNRHQEQFPYLTQFLQEKKDFTIDYYLQSRLMQFNITCDLKVVSIPEPSFYEEFRSSEETDCS